MPEQITAAGTPDAFRAQPGEQTATPDATAQVNASQPGRGVPIDPTELKAELVEVILARDGVVRIEATLLGAIKVLGEVMEPQHHVKINARGELVDVTVNVATRAGCQARTLAHQLRADIADHLLQRGLTPGTIGICVLAIEPAP